MNNSTHNAINLVTTAATNSALEQARTISRVTIGPSIPLPEGADELPFYAQYPLDRKAEWRSDQARLSELFMRGDAILLPLSR